MARLNLRSWLMLGAGLSLAASLSACGGGGSRVGTAPPPPVAVTPPPPPPAPPPPPPPPPPPAQTNFATAEYNRSNGVTSSNAIAAYNAGATGATGAGVTVGVIDSGINPALAEFAGRISAASADTAGSRGLGDDDGHGTFVAGVIAANKNDTGTHGVAFNATLLVARTDTPGSCTAPPTPPEEESGCSHSDNAIARGVDLATTNRARVINISLGGSPANSTLRAAIDRATAAGVVIVFSAGNDGDEPEGVNPDPLSAIALESVARASIIIAGAVDANGQIAVFSNRAGNGAVAYLAALGVRVVAPDQNGQLFQVSGTSFSAPVISGAVALLAQAFPNLTGPQIVDLLFRSARDAGAPGDDSTYGQGILDLARAFQPQGAMALAGSMAAVSDGANATTSPPIGDAGGKAALAAVALDSYGRAYQLDLGGSVRAAAPGLTLAPALQRGGRHLAAASHATAVSLSVADDAVPQPLLLSGRESELARATAGFVASKLDAKTQLALGFGTGGESLATELKGTRAPAFLVANGRSGLDRAPESAVAIRRRLGGWGVTATAETGDALLFERDAVKGLRGLSSRYGYDRFSLGLDRRFGALSLGLEGSRLAERDTVLGARFAPALGASGATSWFVDGAADYDFGQGWSAGATMRWGMTRPSGGAVLAGGALVSNAFAFDVAKTGLARRGDRFAVRIAQPLRVEGGGLMLNLPTGYDYTTLTASFATSRLGLAPEGREIDLEAAYGLKLWRGWLATNLYYRSEPGNLAYAPDDLGAALRFTMGF